MILLITCLVHGLTIPLDHDGSLHKRSEAAVPFYYPVSDAKVPNPLPPNAGTLEGLDLAYAILFEEIGANESDLILDRNYTDSANVEHYFFTRSIQKTAVSNQNAAVHLQGETVLYITSSFNLKSNSQNFVGETISTLTSVSQEDAVLFAESKLNVPRLDNNVTLQFLQTATGSLVYAYVFQLRSSDFSEWYQVSVDSQLGQIVQVVNFVQRATYRVLLRPKNDPTEGFNTVINPWNTLASPLGWHNDGRTTYTVTTGNNIDVVIDKTYRPSGGAALSFTTAWRSSEQPTSATNRAASSIQLFYLLNTLHDILYQYGFTEAAGNFQTSNFNKGGRGNDRVIINHQSKSGVNNANFATPPDGQSGVMNMYLWTLSSPQKDGSMDATIPIHEYGHGVSNRLTGGPSNSACLQSKEAGGMGEGWSDALAVYQKYWRRLLCIWNQQRYTKISLFY
jgi:extracellular elastinolytic metalloproteinase